MENSVLLSWLKGAFSGAEKMLIGKKFPINARALCFAMLELLLDYVKETFKTLLTSWMHVHQKVCS